MWIWLQTSFRQRKQRSLSSEICFFQTQVSVHHHTPFLQNWQFSFYVQWHPHNSIPTNLHNGLFVSTMQKNMHILRNCIYNQMETNEGEPCERTFTKRTSNLKAIHILQKTLHNLQNVFAPVWYMYSWSNITDLQDLRQGCRSRLL